MEKTLNAPEVSGFRGAGKPVYEDYARCVHCGLCLNHCPTYRLWGLEADSPRGRIRQMQLVDQGRLALGDSFVHHMDTCLDCRACETACPSGVEYGKLIESARGQIAESYRRPFFSRLARAFVYRGLLPHPKRIAFAGSLARIYQRSGLQAIARASGILKLFGLADRERLMPQASKKFFFSQLGKTFPAVGPQRARVAFFAGCIAQVSFAELNDATIRVLQANGCEVVVPAEQLCCGALCVHAGERETARSLAQANERAFSAEFLRAPFDAIITNAAGCGSTLKEYDQLFLEGFRGTRAGKGISIESARRNGISCGIGTHGAARSRENSRHVSGFLPPAARPENFQRAQKINSRDTRNRISGNAARGSVLRFGGRLQRHRNKSVSRTSGK